MGAGGHNVPAVLRRYGLAAVWAVCAVACDNGKSDVLVEFPPPRLARESSREEWSARSPSDCTATFRLHGRATRTSYEIPGTGTFELRGGPGTPGSAEVAFDARRAVPSLPPRTLNALASRDPSVGWTWRLLETGGRAHDAWETKARSTDFPSTSELELNAVRTRQSHTLVSKLTRHGGEASLDFETSLRLDLQAHHLGALRMADESVPRRADLLVRCRASTPLGSETTGE